MNKPLKRRAELSRLTLKVLFMMPIYYCIPAMADTSDLVPADIIPPPDFIEPTPNTNTVTPYAAFGIGYESNVLGLQNSAVAHQMGLSGMSDTIARTQFGLAVDETVNRQRLTANASVTQVDYERFTALDNLDRNLAANWNWHVGNQFEGNVGGSYSRGLAPYLDFHLLQANIRTQVNEFVNGSWLFSPSWRVRAGLQQSKVTYDLVSQQFNDNTQNQTELGLDYLARSGSTVGLQLRHTNADFPNPEQIGSLLVPNGYTQDELKGKVDWLLTGKTRLHFLGGWVRREQDAFAVRDFSGFNSRVSADWSPTGKTDITVAAWREIGAVDDLSPVYSLNRGMSIASSWRYSEKIRLVAQVKREKRDFNQSTAFGVLSNFASENDVLLTAALTMIYNIDPKWELRLSGIRSTQTATVTGGYVNNGLLVNLRYAF